MMMNRVLAAACKRVVLARRFYHPSRSACLVFDNSRPPRAPAIISVKEPPESSYSKTHFVPQHQHNKVVTAEDAVSLVSVGDTVAVSGFAGQGGPDKILEALSEQYDANHHPHSLTLIFGGGPGDWDAKGLNRMAKQSPGKPPMLRRTVGGFYGQTPQITKMAVANQIEAFVLPMGAISRMIRAQAAHSPGHVTSIGIGTYVDPTTGSGGALNELARQSELHRDLVTRVQLLGHEYLVYKALPIDVAIIRATTADSMGNLTCENESLLCDQKIIAAAARNSGGIVLAQVKYLAAAQSLPTRQVSIPGPLVDCVVVVDPEEHQSHHPMSYDYVYDPVLTNAIRTPAEKITKMPLTERKVIARRATMELVPGSFVNLGIGLPEGMASVAAEEGLLNFITLTTEAGVIGGLPASGRSFGPGANADALVEMNQMFDLYNGGILDLCCLGAAQVNAVGDVNVSRLTKDALTGPGGFIDISQATRNICFLCTFTAKGLRVGLEGNGELSIGEEGQIKKFLSQIYEKTFSGDEAVRRGQNVYYITERAVFRRTAKHDTLELIEIAPGVDLQKDILSQMEFRPVISPELKVMDRRIFESGRMEIRNTIFGSLEERCVYHEDEHALYIDLFGVTIADLEDLKLFHDGLAEIFSHYTSGGTKPVDVYVSYDGFDLHAGLEEAYSAVAADLESKFYRTVQRYAGKAFHRAKLGHSLRMTRWSSSELFDEFDLDSTGYLSAYEIRKGLKDKFSIHLTEPEVGQFFDHEEGMLRVSKEKFRETMPKIFSAYGFQLPQKKKPS